MVFRGFVSNRNEEKKVKMNKPLYLGLPILEISKTLMYEFLDDYIKPKYEQNSKLGYTGTDSFIINIKIEDFYKDIADYTEKRFGISNMKSIDYCLQERIKKGLV